MCVILPETMLAFLVPFSVRKESKCGGNAVFNPDNSIEKLDIKVLEFHLKVLDFSP